MNENASSYRRPSRPVREFRARMNALRLGLLFVLPRWFRLPRKVRIGGISVPLHHTGDHGVSNDFIVCCIRNDYGLREGLSNINSILDIGANLGFFSIAARASYPNASIHAYEPNPRIFPLLKLNAAPLGVSIYPEAVGAECGYVSMLDNGDSNQAITLSGGTIPQASLASAVERLGGIVDLLKLDCEGAEWDMFRSKAPWRKIRHVRMEYHLTDGRTTENVQSALADLGFKPTLWQHDVGFGIVWASRY